MLTTTAEMPAFGFTETHTRGDHRACWRFPIPRGTGYEIQTALDASSRIARLRTAVQGTALWVMVDAGTVAVVAPTKEAFGSAMSLLRAAVGDTTPEDFTAEIEAVLAARDRARSARKRAEEVLSHVANVREKLVGHARQRAAVALAAEIATLRLQYEALAAEYAAEAARFVEQVLDDKEAFSEVPDAEIVRAEVRASVARHPLRIGGPSIGGGGSLLEGYRFAELPDYGETLESLAKRLA